MDPFEGYVFDEDFVKAATRTEGSARARMLARRWAQEPPEEHPWRTQAPRPRRRRPRLRTIAVVVAVVGLVVFLPGPDRVFGWFGASDTAGGNDSAGRFPGGGVATPGPSGAVRADPFDADRPTRAEPFAGSPALGYADNEAGLVVPVAKAVPGYSAAEVGEALAATRRLLIAGNLDRGVLAGDRATAYFAALDPADGLAARIERAVTSNGWEDDNPLSWLTRFDPTEVELVGRVVKVEGTMSYDTDDGGTLTVHADYSFVYPVARVDGGTSSPVTRSVVRRVLETKVYRGPRHQATRRGRVAVSGTGFDLANSSCTRLDGFVRPGFPDDVDRLPVDTSDPTDPYDRSRPIQDDEHPEQCRRVSRT